MGPSSFLREMREAARSQGSQSDLQPRNLCLSKVAYDTPTSRGNPTYEKSTCRMTSHVHRGVPRQVRVYAQSLYAPTLFAQLCPGSEWPMHHSEGSEGTPLHSCAKSVGGERENGRERARESEENARARASARARARESGERETTGDERLVQKAFMG